MIGVPLNRKKMLKNSTNLHNNVMKKRVSYLYNFFLLSLQSNQLDRFIEKIQKEAEIKQNDALAKEMRAQQEETSKLLIEQKVFYSSYQEMTYL